VTGQLKFRLGIIGGLGPLASADFYRKLTELTPASVDTEHLPLMLLSIPQLPDRTQAILSGSDTVVTLLLDAVRTLDTLGVECIAMPCNTAHHWFDQLQAAANGGIVHIVDSVVLEMARAFSGRRVSVLATQGTLASGFYHDRLAPAGYEVILPQAVRFQLEVDRAIADIKAGNIASATLSLRVALAYCREAGADGAILGCTELSVLSREMADEGLAIIDSNTALATVCLRRLGLLSDARSGRARDDAGQTLRKYA